MEELSEFELLGGEPVQESSFEISIFKIALNNVWSKLGRGQNILGGPKVLFKGHNSVTQRQQETTAILISSFSFFFNVRDNVIKNGPIIHLVLRLKFTLCVAELEARSLSRDNCWRGRQFDSRQEFAFFFLVSKGFEPTCTDL